jgi:acyl carrier protein
MPLEQIETTIRRIVTKVAALAPDASGDADLYLDLGVASVHALELLTGLEEAFGIGVPDEEFVEATSINKLITMITSLMNNATEKSTRS